MLTEEELKFYRMLFENLVLQHYLAYILTHFLFTVCSYNVLSVTNTQIGHIIMLTLLKPGGYLN